nr:AraC family transcriptional regulator [uncultured Massilia sp.]
MDLYREFAPHPLLAGHVACLWTSRARPQGVPVRRRILPDNCIDILWQDRAPAGFVAGMMSRSHLFEADAPVLTVAVRFLPGAARAFFDLPLHLLQDDHPSLDELWPRHEANALAAALWERELSVRARLALIEETLLARLRLASPLPADRLVRAAVRRIEAAHGAVRIEDLARALGVSRQHLALQFRERVGLNAKAFAMVSRFGKASGAVRAAGRDIDWATLALDCGYYDQSHLIHEFRLLAGTTPAAFVA